MGRKPLFSEKDISSIISNSPYKMCDKHQLVSKYNVSERTAERMMKKLGLIQTSSKNIECIMRYLSGENVSKLKKEYGMSQSNLNTLMRFRNIEQRGTKYFCDFHYFDDIDSEDKAYFLGFIYADGNLHKNSLKVSIRDYDVDVLEKMKAFMDSNHPIRKVPLFNFYNEDKKGPKDGEMVEFIITHRLIKNSMIAHGVVENKTHKIKCIPKTIPNHLLKHFMRGYIDGDGSFGRYLKNDGYFRFSLNLVGTLDFLEDFSKKAEKFSGILFNKKMCDRHPERNTNIRQLRLTGKKKVLNFLDWIYSDSTVFMDRKYNKYLEIKKQCENK